MSAIIKQIRNKAGQKVYPITRSNAIYMTNGFTTLDQAIHDLYEGNSKIVFNSDGTITTTLDSENEVTTSFLTDGSIQEVCVNKEGKQVYVKTTIFNEDGSIETRMDWGEE